MPDHRMPMPTPRLLLTAIALLPLMLIFPACASQTTAAFDPLGEYCVELQPGDLGLSQLGPGQAWPDFSIGWQHREELGEACQNSLDYLAHPSSKEYFPYGTITHDLMRRSVTRFQELLETSDSAESFLAGLTQEFQVWMARGRQNSGDVLFTGYGTPIYNGSLTQTARFPFPLYALPDDLVKDKKGNILGRRTQGNQMVPYFTHGELRQNTHLRGQEIVWLETEYDCYNAMVQGSAIINLAGGKRIEIGYAGNNGHDYASIGAYLIDSGKLRKSELSATRLRQYFTDHPAAVSEVFPKNPRFIFFQKFEGGPYGCLGQPVTAMHSLATDKDIFPRAAVVYCEVRLPDFDDNGKQIMRPTRFFALDQDRGGAILSAGRCDVFMGLGEEAMRRAGHVLSRGRMYYLFLKN
ncbi:MAG: hypothetical protein HOM34_06060 [Planctomycetes bacterium]|nr:hypothetical protein [Planctomycetota bacterium]MBT4029304.1 hypothetical protein [Planctomycetota bacterium]MBT4561289.1 hypothetical protein [Planctomycetota bacterium]MBT5120268.1 hypothetical protein [Planctomycetota bacterium]MBT7012365.1 hypothetical protein [Planctomycetota bacterium]